MLGFRIKHSSVHNVGFFGAKRFELFDLFSFLTHSISIYNSFGYDVLTKSDNGYSQVNTGPV